MKVSIPDNLKSDLPQSAWGKILSATPVIMTVVATMLAGLASSEMTRAQYSRSLAAQQQAKAGDQWGFFQAKRLRGAMQRNTMEMLQSLAPVRPFQAEALVALVHRPPSGEMPPEAAKASQDVTQALESPVARQALECLARGELPTQARPPVLSPEITSAIEGIEGQASDVEMASLLAAVKYDALTATLRAAKEQAQGFDEVTKPLNAVIERLNDALARLSALPANVPDPVPATGSSAPGTFTSLYREYNAARLLYTALRYESEARLNQTIAYLYELQVRKSNIEAERHHLRSQRFFFGMLAAQAGVIIATFAIAARKRNLLWSLAAGAGLLAVAFAVYVYFNV